MVLADAHNYNAVSLHVSEHRHRRVCLPSMFFANDASSDPFRSVAAGHTLCMLGASCLIGQPLSIQLSALPAVRSFI